jgi:hypothetical protein
MADIERSDPEVEREELDDFLATEQGQAMRARAAARAREIWDESAEVA